MRCLLKNKADGFFFTLHHRMSLKLDNPCLKKKENRPHTEHLINRFTKQRFLLHGVTIDTFHSRHGAGDLGFNRTRTVKVNESKYTLNITKFFFFC